MSGKYIVSGTWHECVGIGYMQDRDTQFHTQHIDKVVSVHHSSSSIRLNSVSQCIILGTPGHGSFKSFTCKSVCSQR